MAAQGLINHLVLLNPGFAAERARHDMGRIVIAVAAQIFDRYLRVRQALLDQARDRRRIHRHCPTPCLTPAPYNPTAILHSWRGVSPPIWHQRRGVNSAPWTVPTRRAGTPPARA